MADAERKKHRPLVPFNYGTLDENAATFYSNNLVFEGFKNVQIQKSMAQIADNFQITLTDKWQVEKEDFDLRPGSRIHCHLGKESVFEGYVDRFNINITSGSRNITISGRSKTADLVDCTHEGPTDFNDIGFQQLAEQLCSPFGIKIINPDGISMGGIFQKFSIMPGEKVFEALGRAARQRELILLSSTHGNLIVTKRSNKRAGTELVEGINMTLTGATFDNTERHSEYKVKGQQSGLIADIDQTIGSAAKSTDSGIKRYRPLTIIADGQSNSDDAQKRANWESAVRAARGMVINCSVIDWKKKDGKLWAINELVPIEAPSVGVIETLLIKSVSYNLS